ncbi:MAG: hypothetical protein IT228_09285 [Flavobacteriales bacterium]|nr:hypothetical protein [Flavobacteriales bacterium]MCC6577520.1 hypothetical protein [Flavobacteriales bacterium]
MRLRTAFAAAVVTTGLAGMLTVAPWLAMTAPVGAGTLVVEGWIPDDRLPDVLRLARARRIGRVFVTGGAMPLARYLRAGDTLVVDGAPLQGHWVLELAGLPGQRWQLRTGSGVLQQGVADGVAATMDIPVPEAARALRLVAEGGRPGDTTALLFVRDLRPAGHSLSATGHAAWIHHANGGRTPCPATWAEERARQLVALGAPPTAVLAVHGPADAAGRTASAARAMVAVAHDAGLGAYDVVTLGVHARRTHRAHRRAAAGTLQVGVIALSDPRVPPRTWWLRPAAWPVVAKELAGLLRDAFAGTFGS